MGKILDAFNDEAGKINNGDGQYRVMQFVLRENCFTSLLVMV